jgi:hypothetical protein
MDAGYFKDCSLLVAASQSASAPAPGTAGGPAFQALGDAFPDASMAFIPADVLARMRGRDSLPAAAAAVGKSTVPGTAAKAGGGGSVTATSVRAASVAGRAGALPSASASASSGKGAGAVPAVAASHEHEHSSAASSANGAHAHAQSDAEGGTPADGAPEGADADMIDPTEAKAKLSFMLRYFGRGSSWYFLDTAGATQGPFTPEQMASWWSLGYFWSRSLQIAHHGWAAFVTLQSVLDAADTLVLDEDDEREGQGKADVEVAAAVEAVSAAPLATGGNDNQGHPERGSLTGGKADEADASAPSHTRSTVPATAITAAPGALTGPTAALVATAAAITVPATLPAAAAALQPAPAAASAAVVPAAAVAAASAPVASAVQTAAATAVSNAPAHPSGTPPAPAAALAPHTMAAATGATAAPAPATALVAVPPAADLPVIAAALPGASALVEAQGGDEAAVDEWFYVDESGQTQGPFASTQMAEWAQWAYFTDDTLVRHAGVMPAGVFLPLGQLWPEPAEDATDEEVEASIPFEGAAWLDAWDAARVLPLPA